MVDHQHVRLNLDILELQDLLRFALNFEEMAGVHQLLAVTTVTLSVVTVVAQAAQLNQASLVMVAHQLKRIPASKHVVMDLTTAKMNEKTEI